MGELLALATAVTFAISNLFIRLAARQSDHGDDQPPPWPHQIRVLWLTTLVNVALFWLAWLVVGTALSGGRDVTSHELSVGVLAYGAAGMCGPLLGRLVLYRALA
ncbi:MAG TPA: hypothetical protein VIL95_03300, partial [Bacillota bacterium]